MSEGTYQPDSVLDAANTASSPVGQQNVAASNSAGSILSANDLRLIELLRSGNETTFVLLVEQYNSLLLRLAKAFIPVSAVAEKTCSFLGVSEANQRVLLHLPESKEELLEIFRNWKQA